MLAGCDTLAVLLLYSIRWHRNGNKSSWIVVIHCSSSPELDVSSLAEDTGLIPFSTWKKSTTSTFLFFFFNWVFIIYKGKIPTTTKQKRSHIFFFFLHHQRGWHRYTKSAHDILSKFPPFLKPITTPKYLGQSDSVFSGEIR